MFEGGWSDTELALSKIGVASFSFFLSFFFFFKDFAFINFEVKPNDIG